MSSKVSQCHLWSNEQLIHHEVVHRRAIISYITNFTLSAINGVATFGATTPIVVPIAGFEAYKIHSHRKKLKAIREELTRRNLSPNEKKKRDVVIPITTSVALYFASMGIAEVADVIPDAIQTAIHAPIQEGFSLSKEILFEIANDYEAFIVAEITEAVLKGRKKNSIKYHHA